MPFYDYEGEPLAANQVYSGDLLRPLAGEDYPQPEFRYDEQAGDSETQSGDPTNGSEEGY